jgi:hypothetical protein
MAEAPARIWIETAHHAAFRCGGWAWVREQAGERSGAAGGERYVTAGRTGLAGLVAALRDIPKGVGVAIHTSDAALLAIVPILGGKLPPEDMPSEDLELWAPILAAAKDRALRFVRVPAEPRSPRAFAAAWAELARDKAKAAGTFAAAIPKSNLAKIAGL